MQSRLAASARGLRAAGPSLTLSRARSSTLSARAAPLRRHVALPGGRSSAVGPIRAAEEPEVFQASAASPEVDEKKAGEAATGENGAPMECENICSVEPGYPAEAGYSEKQDFFRAAGVVFALALGWATINYDWVAAHGDLSMIIVFVLGYVGIIIEEEVAFNKSGVALIMAVALWTIRALSTGPDGTEHELEGALAEVSEIIFFLMGAMTIVEVVDAHQGFKLITDNVKTNSKSSLMWLVGTLTFFMSAVLDNLTSTIVMVSLLRKLCNDPETRRFLGAVVVIAANAGGAWTPIGDVTTTMLWIDGQITTFPTMRDLVFPSLVSLLVPMGLMSLFADEVKGDLPEDTATKQEVPMAPRGNLVFATGVSALLFVPVFKSLTGLPPYLGMLWGLGFLWLLTDAIHYGEDRNYLQVPYALTRIDTQGVLFFLGILMSVASLDSAGVLKDLAMFLDNNVPSIEVVATLIGVASAIIDNVPLVAATMGMYDIASVPQDSELWQLIAYCAGTGGSMLIIGSAAGVAFMGMEKADFMWYVKRVTPWAATGYVAGIGGYLLQHNMFSAAEPVIAALPAAGALLQ